MYLQAFSLYFMFGGLSVAFSVSIGYTGLPVQYTLMILADIKDTSDNKITIYIIMILHGIMSPIIQIFPIKSISPLLTDKATNTHFMWKE